jgi:hypothetical protein
VFKRVQYWCVKLAIALSLFSTIHGCGNRSPLVEEDFRDTTYTGTGLPQFSKPIPPDVLGTTGIAAQPSLQVQIMRCCHEFRKNRIGGKPVPHTGCDCDLHHLHKVP